MSRRFQLDPSPIYFSTALAGDQEAQAEIIELIKAGEPDPMMPYVGRVNHPRYGRLEWMIYVLPDGDAWTIHQAMGVRLYDEWWSPDFLDRSADAD